jgi:hypothetical protein
MAHRGQLTEHAEPAARTLTEQDARFFPRTGGLEVGPPEAPRTRATEHRISPIRGSGRAGTTRARSPRAPPITTCEDSRGETR